MHLERLVGTHSHQNGPPRRALWPFFAIKITIARLAIQLEGVIGVDIFSIQDLLPEIIVGHHL